MDLIKELVVNTLHVDIEDLPWVETRPGMELRYIHSDASKGINVIQLRAQPWVKSELHRHLGFVFGITTRGAWGHDPKEFGYKPGSFICEPNEVHAFFNGPEISEAFFISGPGGMVDYDDAGNEVVREQNSKDGMQWYLDQCEAKGLPRPNIRHD